MDEDKVKEALKEALKEWMDDKYATFGKWTFRTLAGIALSALVYGLLALNGFSRLPIK